MYKRDIYLDIDDKMNNCIKSVELDSNSRIWHFHLTVDYQPLNLTGKTVMFMAEKPDKTNVLNDCEIIDAENGIVKVELTRQVNAVPGHVNCLLKIVGSDGYVLKTKTFIVEVSKTLSDKPIVSTNEFSALDEALGRVQNIDQRFAKTNAQLSQKANANEVIRKGHGTLSDFDEETRRAIQGLSDSEVQINAVLGRENVQNENLANGSVSVNKTNFLTEIKESYFSTNDLEDGKRIRVLSDLTNKTFSLESDSDYYTTDFIKISTETITFYKYGRIAFFDAEKNIIDYYGRYDDSGVDTINRTVSPLVNSAFIRFSFKKNDVNSMYLVQNGKELVKDLGTTFDSLTLNEKQMNDGVKLLSTNQIPVTCVQSFNLLNTDRIAYDDGVSFVDSSIDGYINNKIPIPMENCSTTRNFIEIPSNITDESVWEFNNVGRIVFYKENKSYFEALYTMDYMNETSNPPKSETLYKRYPSLKDARYMKVSIFTKNKNDWSIKIDGDELIGNVSVKSSMLEVDYSNLSDDLIRDLKFDNSYQNHKDTTYVFERRIDFGSEAFRIPFMGITNLGTIIAGCDIRYNHGGDHSFIDLGTARSEDGGKTWIDKTIAIPNPRVSSTYSRVMDGTILPTREGRVYLIGNQFNDGNVSWTQVNTPNDPNWDVLLYHSDDDGRTWKFNQSLKSLLPSGQISFLGGVGSGIQMSNGTLVFPIQMARYNDTPFNCQSGIIYSTDGGETWAMSASLVPEYTSECTVVEYPTNTILLNCRQEGQNHRSVFSTTDLGTTWTATPMNDSTSQTNPCQGHMIKIKTGANQEVVVFSNPFNPYGNRSNLTLSVLLQDEKFKDVSTIFRPESQGYSCMAYHEASNRLYILMELDYNLVFKDLTYLLPTLQIYKTLENLF